MPIGRAGWTPSPSSQQERQVLQRFIDAWEQPATSALLALLREDAQWAMPPANGLPPGVVPWTWLGDRASGKAMVDGIFADVGEPHSLTVLRTAMAGRALHYGLTDIDNAAIRTSAPRGFTQEISRSRSWSEGSPGVRMTTEKEVVSELVSEGLLHSIGRGVKGSPRRFWRPTQEGPSIDSVAYRTEVATESNPESETDTSPFIQSEPLFTGSDGMNAQSGDTVEVTDEGDQPGGPRRPDPTPLPVRHSASGSLGDLAGTA